MSRASHSVVVRRRGSRRVLLALVALLVGACRAHDVDRSPLPRVEVPDAFAADVLPDASVDGSAARRDDAATDDEAWWSDFGDPALDALVARALASAPGVKAALARVEAAAAVARGAGAPHVPGVDLVFERDASARSGDLEDVRHGWERVREGGLEVSWELDLFGRTAAARDAALGEVEASLDDLAATRLLLSTEVADAYLRALEARLTLRLLDEQVALDATLLELTELRFAQGGASAVDVLQQRGQVASTRALRPRVEAERRLAENRLDVLLGEAPDGVERVVGDGYPEPLPVPAPGVPADLLVRRPDLRALRARLVAQDDRVAAALAERLPRLTLFGSLGRRSDAEGTDFVSSLVAGLVQPLVDGGARAARVDEQRARLEELAQAFAEAFLVALEEVDGALFLERRQRDEVVLLREQVDVLAQNVREARIRYANGLTDYLPVLVAVDDVHATQRQLLSSERELLARRVDFYRALGGKVRPRASDAPLAATPGRREDDA